MTLESRDGKNDQIFVGAGWVLYYDRERGTVSFRPPGPQYIFSQVRVDARDVFTPDLPVKPEELEEFVRNHTGCRLGPCQNDDSSPTTVIHTLIAVESRVANIPPAQPRFIDPADPLEEYNVTFGASD